MLMRLAETMGTSQSALNPFRFFQANKTRDRAIDASLVLVQASLQTLNSAADLLPIAGVGTAMSILQVMVKQIQNTRMNSKMAAELRDEISGLVNSITTIVEEMDNTVKPNIQSLTDEQKLYIKTAQAKKPSLIKGIVDKLIEDLRPLQDDIKKAQAGSWLSRFLCNNDVTSQLDELKSKMAAAKESFQRHQSIVVTRTVEELQSLTEELRAMQAEALSKIDNNKYDDDLRVLKRADAAHDAIGDSGYIEGTRIGILNDIYEWSKRTGEDDLHKFFLLIGEGGTGKSTIAREVCHQLQEEGRLGASFFFVRSDTGALGSIQSVYPTIAFQLASLQKRFRQHIAEAAREFINLPSGSLKKQMESLILNPLKKVQGECPDDAAKPIVIVIDALDEATGELATLLESLKELVNKEPQLRVFITTRPEPPIIYAVKSAGIDLLGRQRLMSEIPQDEVDSDIQLYLKMRFQQLRHRDKLLAKHPDAIVKLTKKAERLFIYARTVIQYLNCKAWEVSVERLDKVLFGSPGTSGMSALYELYDTVLKNAYDEDAMDNETIQRRVRGVLAGLVVLQEQASVRLLAPLMGVTMDEAVETVGELRSIVTCTGDMRRDAIRPLHLTLREFLVDEKRCPKEFYVDRHVHHIQVARSCLRIMNDELRQDICQLGNAFKGDIKDLGLCVQERISPHVQYACTYWTTHLVRNEPTIDSDLQSLLVQFCETKVLQWIEALSSMNRLDSAVQALLCVTPWAKVFTRVATILEDAYRLVTRFYEPIYESPAQIYTSALPVAPKCLLVDLYAEETRNKCMVSPRDRFWGTCLNTVSAKSGLAQYSRDGQIILSWSKNEIVIRDAITANPRKTIRREKEIISADIHPNSQSVVLLSEDGGVEEWNWTSESQSTRVYALPERDKSMSWHGRVTYDNDGSRIVCHWGIVNAIFVWSTEDRIQSADRISIPDGMRCETFCLDAEGDYVVALLTSENDSAIVQRWNIKTGEMTSSQLVMDPVWRAVFGKNSKMLITAHYGKMCVWHLEDDCWMLATTINDAWDAFGIAPSGEIFASGYRDITFWDARSGKKLGKYQGHTDFIKSLGFSSQEGRLVSTSADRTIRIWNIRPEALSFSPDSTPDLYRVTFSPNGKYIAAVTDLDVRVFHSSDGLLRTEFIGHTTFVQALAFSADGSLLATYQEDDGVFLWDVEGKGSHPRTLSQSKQLGRSLVLTFNANATLLAAVSPLKNSFTIRIWSIETRPNETEGGIGKEELLSEYVHGPPPHGIRFKPAEPLSLLRRLKQNENRVVVWDHTRNALETCPYDEGIYSALKPAFIIEGGWIVSMRTRRRLLWLPEDRRTRYAYRFAANGDMIAVASDARVFTVLDMSRLSNF